MANCFIITNQDGHYWGSGKAWVMALTQQELPALVIATRQVRVFELSSKDFSLRASIQSITLTDGKLQNSM